MGNFIETMWQVFRPRQPLKNNKMRIKLLYLYFSLEIKDFAVVGVVIYLYCALLLKGRYWSSYSVVFHYYNNLYRTWTETTKLYSIYHSYNNYTIIQLTNQLVFLTQDLFSFSQNFCVKISLYVKNALNQCIVPVTYFMIKPGIFCINLCIVNYVSLNLKLDCYSCHSKVYYIYQTLRPLACSLYFHTRFYFLRYFSID